MKEYYNTCYNNPNKTFYCKRCKSTSDTIYKDENGNTYCPKCKPDKR